VCKILKKKFIANSLATDGLVCQAHVLFAFTPIMKIIIIGTGDVGFQLCKTLSLKGHEITAIERDEELAEAVDAATDACVIPGDGCNVKTLEQAGVSDADYILAMTNDDRTNLIISSIAKALGAKHTIVRVHDSLYTHPTSLNYQIHFQVDAFIEPETLCAAEFAKEILNPERVAIERFARGHITVQQIPISPSSTWIGQPLCTLDMGETARFVYLKGNQDFLLPTAKTTLQAGDLATVVATPDVMTSIKAKLNPEARIESLRIVIFSATPTAKALIPLLAQKNIDIYLIEKNLHTCRRFAEQFPDIHVIHGDGTSRDLLLEQGIDQADFFVACGPDDEDNIMTGIQSICLGAKQTQFVIHKTDYDPVFKDLKAKLHLGYAASPRVLATKEVLRYLNQDPYTEIGHIPGTHIKIWEIKVAYDALANGQKLRHIPLPKPCMILALIHKFHAKIPQADDCILGGDRIILISQADSLHQLIDLFN